jgi:hypothetical protein
MGKFGTGLRQNHSDQSEQTYGHAIGILCVDEFSRRHDFSCTNMSTVRSVVMQDPRVMVYGAIA